MKHWLKLLAPDGEGGGTAVAAPEAPSSAPSTESAPSTPSASESLSETPSVPTERVSPITADVAERLGVTSAKPIEVKPLAALGLDKAPRDAINDLLAKDAAKITRNIPFEKKPVPSGGPAAKPAASTSTPTPPAQPPAVTPPAPVAATPPANAPGQVQKYKVGDKEYTPEQMQAYLDALNQRQPQVIQQQAPQPQQPNQPQLTPDQQRQMVAQRESQFVAETAPHIDLSRANLQVSPEQADILAAGGEPAATLWNQMLQRSVAYGTLLSRKTIANELNPIIGAHAQAIQREQQARQAELAPLMEQARQVAVYETEQAFVTQHPELAEHLDTARVIGHELVHQYPDWAKSVSRDEFCRVIAEQTPVVLKRFGVTVGSRPTTPTPTTPPAAPQAPRTATPGTPARVTTSKGPKPPAPAAPGRPAAAPIPTQSRDSFQKVAVSSIGALR